MVFPLTLFMPDGYHWIQSPLVACAAATMTFADLS
jgi:hypothetical protein